MILKINDDYRITTDDKCITLEKRRVIKEATKSKTLKAGDEVFDAVGFYGEFEHAYKAMLKHGILSNDLEGIRAILNWIERTDREIKESLSMANIESIRKENDRLIAEVESLKKKIK
jgi:HPt (histidine-containing phosphotransfer) domain-containing protein